MLADLHVHYPMRVVEERDGREPGTTVRRMGTSQGRSRLADKVRAVVLRLATRLLSDKDLWSGYRVTVPYLSEGDVGILFSALYRPFEEMDLSKPYQAPPAPAYFAKLLEDLDAVEEEVATYGGSVIRVVHNRSELEQCLSDEAIAVVHAVEGGFHLGDGESEIAAERRHAGAAGCGLRDGRAPVLSPGGDERQRDSVPSGCGLQRVLSTGQERGPDRSRSGGDPRDGGQPCARRHLAHATERRRGDVRAPQPARPTWRGAGHLLARGLSLRQAAIHARRADGERDQAPRRCDRPDHGPAPAQRRDPQGHHDEPSRVARRDPEAHRRDREDHRQLRARRAGHRLRRLHQADHGGLERAADLASLERELANRYHGDAEAIASGNVLRVLRQVWE